MSLDWRTKTLGLRGLPARGVKPTPLQRERLARMVRCSHCWFILLCTCAQVGLSRALRKSAHISWPLHGEPGI